MNNWGVAQSGSLIVDSLFFDSYLFKFYSFTKVYEINSCDWRPGDVYFLHFLYFKSYPMASSGLGLKKTDSGISHLPCRSAQCNTYWLIDWWKPEAYVCSLFSKGAFHFHFNICAAAMTSVFVTFFLPFFSLCLSDISYGQSAAAYGSVLCEMCAPRFVDHIYHNFMNILQRLLKPVARGVRCNFSKGGFKRVYFFY